MSANLDALRFYIQNKSAENIHQDQMDLEFITLIENLNQSEKDQAFQSYQFASTVAAEVGWDNMIQDDDTGFWRMKTDKEGFDVTISPKYQMQDLIMQTQLEAQNAEQNYNIMLNQYNAQQEQSKVWENLVLQQVGVLPGEFRTNNVKDVIINIGSGSQQDKINGIIDAIGNVQDNRSLYQTVYNLFDQQDDFFKKNSKSFAGLDGFMNQDEFNELVRTYKHKEQSYEPLLDHNQEPMFTEDGDPMYDTHKSYHTDVPGLNEAYTEYLGSQNIPTILQTRQLMSGQYSEKANYHLGVMLNNIKDYTPKELSEAFGEEMAPYVTSALQMGTAEDFYWFLMNDPTGKIEEAISNNPLTSAPYAALIKNHDMVRQIENEWVDTDSDEKKAKRWMEYSGIIDALDPNNPEDLDTAFKAYQDNLSYFADKEDYDKYFNYIEAHWSGDPQNPTDLGEDFTSYLTGKPTAGQIEELLNIKKVGTAGYDDVIEFFAPDGTFDVDMMWQYMYGIDITDDSGYYFEGAPENVPLVSPMKKDFQMRNPVKSILGGLLPGFITKGDKTYRPHYNLATGWTHYDASSRTTGPGGVGIISSAFYNNNYYDGYYDEYRVKAEVVANQVGNLPGFWPDYKAYSSVPYPGGQLPQLWSTNDNLKQYHPDLDAFASYSGEIKQKQAFEAALDNVGSDNYYSLLRSLDHAMKYYENNPDLDPYATDYNMVKLKKGQTYRQNY